MLYLSIHLIYLILSYPLLSHLVLLSYPLLFLSYHIYLPDLPDLLIYLPFYEPIYPSESIYPQFIGMVKTHPIVSKLKPRDVAADLVPAVGTVGMFASTDTTDGMTNNQQLMATLMATCWYNQQPL